MASRRPISCIRQWKHLEEIRFPFKASVRTSLPCLVFYRPLCRGICHRGPCSCSYANSKWWKRWVFLDVLNPALSALLSCSVFCRSSSTNYFLSFLLQNQWLYCIFFSNLSVSSQSSSPLPTPLPPQRFWHSLLGYGSTGQQLRIRVKSMSSGAWWPGFKSFTLPLTSYVTLGKLAYFLHL